MKKVLFITAYFLIVLCACNKDKKFNKSLDGTWITTSIDGVPVTMADAPVQYKFSKSSKEGGTVRITYFNNYSVEAEYSGTYKISNKGKTVTIDAEGTNAEPDIHHVGAVSDKTDKKFTMRGNFEARRGFVFESVYILEKQ